jgi:hypothetical protein
VLACLPHGAVVNQAWLHALTVHCTVPCTATTRCTPPPICIGFAGASDHQPPCLPWSAGVQALWPPPVAAPPDQEHRQDC